jgi:hypothetical protein
MFGRTIAAAVLAAGLALSGAARAQGITPPPKNDYAKPEAWLCWTGKPGDACAIDLTTTVVAADGATTVEKFKAADHPPIDCFYVYPTVSNDPGVISDMNPGPEELNVVKAQLARFGSKCRIYAPMYRQITLTALRAGIAGTPLPGQNDPAYRGVGYGDVLDAWNYYLAHENHGRGVVLIGHSQGSGVLTQLIAREIDGKPAQKLLVSAILMGTRLPIDAGKDTGLFKAIPLCKAPGQIGCVIAYASFRDTIPPPENSRFGKAPGPTQIAACTNPAALAGGRGELHAYMSNAQIVNSSSQVTWIKGKENPKTPFVSLPGMLTAECVQKNGFSYLEVHVAAAPGGARASDIPGDVVANGKVSADWGLHLVDANLAMGNLVDIVAAETKTWQSHASATTGVK